MTRFRINPYQTRLITCLQACQAGDQPCLIRIDTKAGHGGGKPLAKRIEEQADIYSFIFYNMGIRPSLF